MRYKRFSRVSWTFSIPKFRQFFKESDFFNSHACYQHLCLSYRLRVIRNQEKAVFLRVLFESG
jgi:hypothetical protein